MLDHIYITIKTDKTSQELWVKSLKKENICKPIKVENWT
jgi:hypothetical protein